MTSGKVGGPHRADDPQVQVDQSVILSEIATLELNDAADQSAEKRKAERNRRKKLNARKNKAEKARQEFEERELLGSASQDTKIPSSVGSGKVSKSLASDCFDGSSSIDCVVGSPVLAQEKTEVYFSNAMFEIKATPGKGLGVFAAQDIKKETEVLREAPLMKCGLNWLLKEAFFMSLNEEKKNVLKSLHSHCSCNENPCRETTLMKIYDVNSFDIINDKPERTNYIYHFASRINHECLPNMARGNTKNGELVFTTVRDIKRGEELTTFYQVPFGTTLARRKILLSKYGFTCMCKACINNKVLNNYGETLKYAPWIIAKESGSEILNKPTLEEMQTAKEVESWYESVSQAAEKAVKCMTIAIGSDLLQSQSTQERRHLIVENTLQVFDDFLRKNNPYGLSDEVISAYRYRASILTFRAAKQVFNSIVRGVGISVEEF
ncbi:uncharacterized protein EAE98_011412 [Botrytis deweyae]|uniref:SET domain-containing protein n=1 Tax=Botrytis deweyae TaxID=2478750 RepID=A0ABQ7I5U8_9HELO|nr:uncharacterized protein EAE98_011412 [Botrytis deweyae]KAF7914713.1 hypothetical protein EAE98_011412 [Botrytis deweyae]